MPGPVAGRIVAPKESVLASVGGEFAGQAAIFWHDILHQGEPLGEDDENDKWLLITQVMFERDPDTAQQLTPDQRQARRYLQQAEEAEEEGKITEAIRLYNKAYRLDRTLEA